MFPGAEGDGVLEILLRVRAILRNLNYLFEGYPKTNTITAVAAGDLHDWGD